ARWISQPNIGKEILGMPTNEQPNTDADHITNDQKCVSRAATERLLGGLLTAHDRGLNRSGLVGVMSKVFSQPRDQMPAANHEKRNDNRPAGVIKNIPEMGLEHSEKERRQKKRNRREHSSLSLQVFASITVQHFIDYPVPTCLHRQIPSSAGMLI